jgi:hypothetical protein
MSVLNVTATGGSLSRDKNSTGGSGKLSTVSTSGLPRYNTEFGFSTGFVALRFWRDRGLKPGANVTKLFTAAIYHYSMVIPSFCVIKLHYLGNYCEMAVNYRSILTLEKVGLELPR